MKSNFMTVAAVGTTIATLSLASPSQAAQFFYGLTGDTASGVTQTAQDAEQAFLSNFDSIYVETFEGYDVGTIAYGGNSLDIDFQNGSSAILSGGGAIRDAEFNGLHAISGQKYWSLTFGEQVQDTYTIDFSQPVAALGFYTTDMGDAGNNQFSLELAYADNTTEQLQLPHGDENASEFYFGYINPDKLLSRVTFLTDGPIYEDGFGLDNLTLGSADQLATVPEPTSVFSLFVLGSWGVCSWLKRKSAYSK